MLLDALDLRQAENAEAVFRDVLPLPVETAVTAFDAEPEFDHFADLVVRHHGTWDCQGSRAAFIRECHAQISVFLSVLVKKLANFLDDCVATAVHDQTKKLLLLFCLICHFSVTSLCLVVFVFELWHVNGKCQNFQIF